MILVLVAALASCKKTPEVNLKYVDVERDLVTVGTTTANIQCDYEYIATLKKAYLYYGEGEDEADMNVAEMRVVQKTLYVELVGLKENTTYHYYYEFHNGFNSMRTAQKSFKTETSPASVTLPTVITAEVTEITTNSAKSGGEVTNDGGAEVTERGICWGTDANPTLSDSHVAAGTGTGSFSATMSDLQANTTYHVRAYATNSAGTAYGLDKEFTTLSGGGGSGVPEGAINGLFTINENGDQVYFSQGNLQYQASTNTWRFAENQWDFVGSDNHGTVYVNGVKCDNLQISSSYGGWIDLFGWGTSGYNHGAVCYQPWSYSIENEDYYAYGQISNYLYQQTGQADWGYNSISNGGNVENIWRTLTESEWGYIFRTRQTLSGMRYAKAEINETIGVLILPDNWDVSNYDLFEADNYWWDTIAPNMISITDWNEILEPLGVVFLPAAGSRYGTQNWSIGVGNCSGYYWSSTCRDSDYFPYVVHFYQIIDPVFYEYRRNGLSVRLVQDANPQNKAK